MPREAALDRLAAAVHAELAAGLREGEAEIDSAAARAAVRRAAPLLAAASAERVVELVVGRAGVVAPFAELWVDPEVSEIMVNPDGAVWAERRGRLERSAEALSAAAVHALIEATVGPLGLRVDRASPLADARLADGSRVNIVLPPLALGGPCVTIRRFIRPAATLEDLCGKAVAELLGGAVAERANLVVSGGTGAGKTTLLNALAGAVPADERIVTVEETAELALRHPHVVGLEARPANAEGAGEVTIRQLVRNALRMRPTRIVVGEARGAEVVDMLAAMNTGHAGSLSTCHANSPRDALRRLELMALMAGELPPAVVRELVAASVDVVVHLARRGDGERVVARVCERVEGDPGGLGLRPLVEEGRVVAAPTARWRP
ncbi:MAG: CpaF family protein [Acidimicrobiales bacterium]